MKRTLLFLLPILLVAYSWGQALYFPPLLGNQWDSISPSSLNWSQDSIQALYSFLDQEESKGFVLLKDGKIVLEQYFDSYSKDSLWVWFSAGKSLRAALLGVAQAEGTLNIQQKSHEYLGRGWTLMQRAREDSIRIWHQLTMTSGLNEAFFSCVSPVCLLYKADAGSRWAYHNGPYNLLKDVLETATGESINSYTKSRIKDKIGMKTGTWVQSGNNTFFFSRARDMARFGLMIQAGGQWDGQQVIADTAYLRQMISSSQQLNPSYGYLWWLNGKSSYIPPDDPQSVNGPIAPDAPMDVYTAAGAQGQFISISPSLGLVMIRQGASSFNDLAALDLHNEIWKRIMALDKTTHTSLEEEAKIQLFPNPASSGLTVTGVEERNLELRLYDLNGKVLRHIRGQHYLDLIGIAAGVYQLEIRNDEQVMYKKVIIQSD